MEKYVWDVGNKQAWKDDSLIRRHAVAMEYDRHRPRTVLAVCPWVPA